MKKTLFYALLPLFLFVGNLFGIDAQAQQTSVNIGGGLTSSIDLPFNCTHRFSYNQMVYYQNEVGDAGYIGAISFVKPDYEYAIFSELTIWMGHTSDSVMTEGSWVNQDSLQQVFHAYNFEVSGNTLDLLIVLDSAFRYDGDRNLAIVVSRKDAAAYNDLEFRYSGKPASCLSRGSYADSSYAEYPSGRNGEVSGLRPNITLTKNVDEAFCLPIISSRISVDELTENSIEFSWPRGIGVQSYEVAILNTQTDGENFSAVMPRTVSETSYRFNGLSANTEYKIGVREVCREGSPEWSSVVVSTTGIPDRIPFSCNFDTPVSRLKWILGEGDFSNWWVIDTNATGGDTSMYSMYITSDTITHSYQYNNNVSSVMYAKYLLNFDTASEYMIDYDWRYMGERYLDYFRALLVKASESDEFVDGRDIAGLTYGSTPPGLISLDEGREVPLDSGWRHHSSAFDIPKAGNYYLVFMWRNDDNRLGMNPPVAIDNISIDEVSCYSVDSVRVDSITSTSVTITTYCQSNIAYELRYRVYGTERYETIPIGPTFTLENLRPNTFYEATLRTLCGTSDSSYRVFEFEFGTKCEVIETPWICGFEDPFLNDEAPVQRPYCWEVVNAGSPTNYWCSGESMIRVHSGRRGLFYYSMRGSGSDYDDWLFTPIINFAGSVELCFWAKTTSPYTEEGYRGRFAIYASTEDCVDGSDTTYYDRLTITGDSVVNNFVDFAGNEWQKITISLPESLVGEHRLAFVVKDAQSYSFCLDDIHLYSSSDCAMPEEVHLTALTSSSASVTWTGNAPAYRVAYGEVGTAIDMLTTEEVDSNSVVLDDLVPTTTYEFRVMALCDSNEASALSYPIEFTTGCSPITMDQFPFEEDFEDNLTGVNHELDDCWYRGTNYSINYPYVTNDEVGDSATNSLLFGSGSLNYSYVVLPQFEEDLSNLIFRCNAHRSVVSIYSSDLSIGLIKNPNDISTFTPFDTISPSSSSEWEEFRVALSTFNSEAGSYIAILLPAGQNGKAYLDNIVVEVLGDCNTPTDPVVVSTTATTATVAWTDSVANGWIVYYGEPGFDIDTVSNPITVVGSQSAEIIGLTPFVTYEFVVIADCGRDNYSLPTEPVQFTTACQEISTLPYFEDFESYGAGTTAAINPCWVKGTTGSNQPYPYLRTYSAVNGYVGLYFKAYESEHNRVNSYVALPTFLSPINQLKIKFLMKSEVNNRHDITSYSRVAVGVMANPNDLTTFDTLTIFDMSDMPDQSVSTYEYMFNNYTGENRYIAMLAINSDPGSDSYGSNQFGIDDIEVNRIPTCQRPTQLSATAVSSSTIDLSWEDNASTYEVRYSTNADFSNATVVTALSNSIQLTGLSEYTSYYIDLRNICGVADTSEWMLSPLNVRTDMVCGEGYQNIIDTIGDGTGSSSYLSINTEAYYRDARTWTIFTKESLDEMNLLEHNNVIKSISLQVDDAGSPVQFRIYMAETSQNVFTYTIADTIALSQMTLVCDSTIQFAPHSWNNLKLQTPFTYSDSLNLMIAFERVGNVSTSTYFYNNNTSKNHTAQICKYAADDRIRLEANPHRPNIAFNICSEVPNCIRPLNPVVNAITDSEVSLSWEGSASIYQIAYGEEDFNPNSVSPSELTTVIGNSTTVQNLQSYTTYYIYLRSVCGTEGSIWSGPVVAKTKCAPFDLPYSESFDSYQASINMNYGQTLNHCWKKGTNSTSPYPYLTTAHYPISIPNCLVLSGGADYYSYVVLPRFVSPIDSLSISFAISKSEATGGTFYVGVLTDPNDISTFQKVASVQPNAINAWEHIEVSFASYTGTGRYISLMMPDSISSNAYVDDIEVFKTPTCPSPNHITVSTEGTTAVVQWTDRAIDPAGGYQLEYGPRGFELGTGTRISSTTNPTTLLNLNAGEDYDLYVRAICSATDEGKWSYVVPFSIECGPVRLPQYYDFEDFVADENVLHRCFHHFNDAQRGLFNTYPYVKDQESEAHSGTKYLSFYTDQYPAYCNHSALIFPEVDTAHHPMNGNQVVFWGKYVQSSAHIMVGVMSNPTDFATFTAIDTIILTNEYTEYTVPLDSYTGTGTYPVLATYRPTSELKACIDDVTIEEIPACPRAFNLAVTSVSATTATLAWNDTIGTTQWVLEYHQPDSDIIHSSTITTNPYTLTGLTPTTTYLLNIRPICASGDTTLGLLNDVEFCTSQVPATIPYAYDFEDIDEWNNWQINSNCNINWYRGSALAYQGTHSMYISNTNGFTDGTNWTSIVNAVAYRDFDFGTDTASYTLTFKTNVGGTIDHNYDGISVLLVDPSEVVESSNRGVTTPWGPINNVSMLTVRKDTTWGTYNVHLENISGIHRIAFYWYNQSTGNRYPYIDQAGAIDDISIQEQTCQRPYNLIASNTESSSVKLTWLGSSSEYEVAYCIEGDTVVTKQIVQGDSLILQNLQSVTTYQFQVRAICGANDTSYWSNIGSFRTTCHLFVAADTIREDFTSWDATEYNSTSGILPECWESYTNSLNGITPHVIGSGDYWYAHDDKSLIMISGTTNINYGTESIVRLPYTLEHVRCLAVSFWMCTESASRGLLEVGYVTDINLSESFVAIKSINASFQTRHHTTGNQEAWAGFYDTVSFSSAPTNAQAIAFRWTSPGSYFAVCLDDIVVTTTTTCPDPIIDSINLNYEQATLTWNGTASQYQLLYKEASASDWSDTILVTGNTYTLTDLMAETTYKAKLRSLCGSVNGNSSWAEVEFTTDDLPCTIPEYFITSNIDYYSAILNWQANENAQRWVVKVYNTADTILDTVDAHPYTIEGLLPGIEYSASVKSICSKYVNSDWCEPISFTTRDCRPVSNVLYSKITENSVTLKWKSGSIESQWQISYGPQGFDQDEGTLVDVYEKKHILTGLEPETTYDLYVRAMCSEEFYSVWSRKITITTLESLEGIDGIKGNYQFNIYPNPTSNATTISLNGVEGKVVISVVDMNGRTVANEAIECGIDCEKRIDVAGLAQGTYFVRVLGDNINSVRKLIVR